MAHIYVLYVSFNYIQYFICCLQVLNWSVTTFITKRILLHYNIIFTNKYPLKQNISLIS